jgi:hypothetical protein
LMVLQADIVTLILPTTGGGSNFDEGVAILQPLQLIVFVQYHRLSQLVYGAYYTHPKIPYMCSLREIRLLQHKVMRSSSVGMGGWAYSVRSLPVRLLFSASLL